VDIIVYRLPQNEASSAAAGFSPRFQEVNVLPVLEYWDRCAGDDRCESSMETAMRAVLAALAIALMTLSAQAQMGGGGAGGVGGGHGHRGQAKKPDEPAKKKVDDKDYKSALDRLPDKKFDPWRETR
jgi:hypothetical protein